MRPQSQSSFLLSRKKYIKYAPRQINANKYPINFRLKIKNSDNIFKVSKVVINIKITLSLLITDEAIILNTIILKFNRKRHTEINNKIKN